MMRQAFVYAVWSIPARSVCFVCLLSVQCFTADFEKKIHSRKHENNLLETHKKFNFVTSRGQFTGKTWHKIFLKQFLADFKIIRDSIIMITVSPMCQMFIKKVKKQRARKFDWISWNSNHKSPCEINRHLLLTQTILDWILFQFRLGTSIKPCNHTEIDYNALYCNNFAVNAI